LSPKSLAHIVSDLRSFLRFLGREGRVKNGRPRPPVAERERYVDSNQSTSTKESRYSTASTKSQSRAAIVKSIGLKFV